MAWLFVHRVHRVHPPWCRTRLAFQQAEPVEQPVCGAQFGQLAGQPDPAAVDQQQMVDGLFEIAQHMGGEQDRALALRDIAQQQAEGGPAHQRVAIAQRLVEQQQPGPLAAREGEGEQGALAAGEGPGAAVERDPAQL
ncbi:hypothetical protein ACF1FE_34595 [Streptomyces griseofuscus]|uniref:hypothetical protein n=1 Tax=Streptomyces griseofuscus TaxID=146922 RepID=UPI0036FC6638